MPAQVYTEHTAARTFRNALADTLGVVRTAPACLERVEGLLRAQSERSTTTTVTTAEAAFTAQSGRDGTSATHSAAAAAVAVRSDETEEGVRTVNALMDALGCESPKGATRSFLHDPVGDLLQGEWPGCLPVCAR